MFLSCLGWFKQGDTFLEGCWYYNLYKFFLLVFDCADRVFGSGYSNEDVYVEVAQPIVESALDGFNGTIFAYGQTSSGTYDSIEQFVYRNVFPWYYITQ